MSPGVCKAAPGLRRPWGGGSEGRPCLGFWGGAPGLGTDKWCANPINYRPPPLISCIGVPIHQPGASCFSTHRFYADNWEMVLLYQTVPLLPDGLSHLPGCKKGGEQRLYYVKVGGRGGSLTPWQLPGNSLVTYDCRRSICVRHDSAHHPTTGTQTDVVVPQ